MRRPLIALAVALAVLLPGAPAWAHNQLTGADPAADTTVAAAPTKVTLSFLGDLKPGFTTIVVSDAARRRVPAAEPAISGPTGTLTLNEDLANGPYTVAYRAVSADGHIVQGAYAFTVADPAKPAPATSSAAAVAAPKPGGGIPVPVLLGLAAAGVALGGLALVLFLRRGRVRAG